MTQQYGYVPPYKPHQSLAKAATQDPYGLSKKPRPGPLGLGAGQGFASAQPQHGAAGFGGQPAGGGSTGAYVNQPFVNPGGRMQTPAPTPTAASVNHYDLNTDPALQTIQALVGMADEQARAEALKERQNLLLAYGDPDVTARVLGPNDPIVDAASNNPTSTVKQLHQQRDRNLHDLTEGLNSRNLSYSGFRINQEQQAATDFQNILAQAAAGLNGGLDQVTGNLNAALSGNNAQRAQAISDAAARAAAAAAAAGVDPGAGGSDPTATPPPPPPPPPPGQAAQPGVDPNSGGQGILGFRTGGGVVQRRFQPPQGRLAAALGLR
jgi:hypothetical protein